MTRSETLLDSVASTRLQQADTLASQDFLAVWKESIVGEPIKLISERIAELEVGRRVMVTPRVKPEVEEELHGIIKKIDKSYTSAVHLAEHLKKLPDLEAWIMAAHCLIQPYSISIQRWNDDACCGKFRSPVKDEPNQQKTLIFPRRCSSLVCWQGWCCL